MQDSNLRGLQRNLRFEGAEDGFPLAGWLRLYGNTREGGRVVKLIRDLQRLLEIWPNLPAREPDDAFKDEIEKAFSELRRGSPVSLNALMKEGNAECDKIREIPMTVWRKAKNLEQNALARSIDAQFKNLFSPPAFIGFKTEDGKKRTVFMRFSKPRFRAASLISEPLENLGRLGLLHRIRQCPSCGLWLFAKSERERHCSDRCREKKYRRGQEGKRKRRDYMRRYRAGLKRRDQNNLKVSAKARG